MSSTNFVFFGPIGKTRRPLWPLIGWNIFDFSSETAERNSTKLDRKQDLNFLCQSCVFRADRVGKTRWSFWPLIGWDIFDFSFDWIQWYLIGRKIFRNILYQVCLFGPIWKKQDSRPDLRLAKTFSTYPLKLLNRIQRNFTEEARSQCPLPSCVFGPNGMVVMVSD